MATAVVAVEKEAPPQLPGMITSSNSTITPAAKSTTSKAENAINDQAEKETRRLEREKLLAKRLLWFIDVAKFLRVRYSCNAYWSEVTDHVLEKDVEQVLSIAGQTAGYAGSQPSSKSFMVSSFGMSLQNAAGSEQPKTTDYLSSALKAAVEATLNASVNTRGSPIDTPGLAAGMKQQQTNQPFSTTGQGSFTY